MTITLTILGLGPGNPTLRTLESVEALQTARRILLRTAVHPGLQDLVSDPRVESCDDLYESGGSFEAVYEAIANRVLSRLLEGDLVFAVPGHPLTGERTVSTVLERAREQGIVVRVIPGISAIDVVAVALGIDPMALEVQMIDATDLHRFSERAPFNGSLPDVSPLRPVLVSQLYSPSIASAAKLVLAQIFPDNHPIVVVSSAGIAGSETVRYCNLFELDRGHVDHLTSVWIPALDELSSPTWPLTLHRIAAHLRAPAGCPWDRKQTHQSLRSAVIEEAYEVASAIDKGDSDHLAEELGDLLLHVAMHAQIAEEAGEFSVGDVYEHVNRKLIRRHPHVFGSAIAETPDQVVQTWDAVKASERAARGEVVDEEPDQFDRLPKSMPVLLRVANIFRKSGITSTPSNDRQLGDELLLAVERVVKSGLDPEIELERAYRRQQASGVRNRTA